MSYTTTACIDKAALQHNFARVQQLTPGRRILAMIKANGYGHGLIMAAKTLTQADAFGVARLQEALILREAGITQPIVLMEGFFEAAELDLIIKHKLEVIVHQTEQVALLSQADPKQPIKVWLKLDTGMHRLGLAPDEFISAWQALHTCPHIAPDIILTTHFAQADDLNSDATMQQIRCFEQVTKNLPGPRSLANSAGILGWPKSLGDWVRPGLMLYGISPLADKNGLELDLLPVMTLTAQVLAIQSRKRGDALGYGATFTCPENMPVGIISAGYGDGYPQYIPPTGTPILVNGIRTQVIARVSMDMLYVDLRPIAHPHLGDIVTLWGQGLPVENIARAARSSTYELCCGITSRVSIIHIPK